MECRLMRLTPNHCPVTRAALGCEPGADLGAPTRIAAHAKDLVADLPVQRDQRSVDGQRRAERALRIRALICREADRTRPPQGWLAQRTLSVPRLAYVGITRCLQIKPDVEGAVEPLELLRAELGAEVAVGG